MMICRSKAVSVFDYRNIDLGEYAAPFVMNEETLQQKLENCVPVMEGCRTRTA